MKRLLFLIVSLPLAGCALISQNNQAPLSDQLGQIDQVLLQAQAAHVDDYAATTLRAARKNYKAAQHAMADNKLQLAHDLATEALLQAHLATLQAQAARARANAMQMQRDIDQLHHAAKLPGDAQ